MSDLSVVRAHLECAKQGYAVHFSCLGECTWREETEDYYCHRCDKQVQFGSVCDPPGHDYYERDVAFLLNLLDVEKRANAHAIAELCGQVNSLRAGAAQTELIRGLPLPKDVERLIATAKAWHEWREGHGGLEVHATESDLFDAVEALDR